MSITSSRGTAPSRRRGGGRGTPEGEGGPGGGDRGNRSTARDRRRRRGRRARVALLVCLSLVVLGGAGVGWVYLKLNGNIQTFDSGGLSDNRPAGSSKGENVLVIGSDARTDGNAALGGGDKDGIGRSDTTLLLHIYADHKHALAVSIPRDTLVTIPPCKLPTGGWTQARPNTMFNAAFSVGETDKGNPACTQNTVERLTGLRVDHTVVVDFKGFAALTEVVGGVKVCLPNDIYQKDLNPNRATQGTLLFRQGEQNVSGRRALDYVRLRHGIGDGSDIGRIKRQQAFVGSLLKEVKDKGFTPTKLLPLADAATDSMTVDPGLGSADKLLSFAMSLKDVDLHNTKFVTVPWRYAGSRVAVVEPDAGELWAALRADRTIDGADASGGKGHARKKPGPAAQSPAPVSGEGISVAVYNGTTVTGLAAKGSAALTASGFTVTGTATALSQNHLATVVQYGPGMADRARTVAKVFPGAQLEQIGAARINVVLGQAYATDPTPSTSASVPSEVANGARSADDNPCANLTYG
ncbi:LCP family protein [Streptomyces sp. BV129]|uniref:LCP family protein n=1 Tax=Streptomyces sp. BV129 TaxID=2849671 RepID=UPI001C2E77D1|nr:LCP family protein [Streptomyces sp. BV129]MBV1948000.1 LCP family protein [Streptomyces sp. BV129]